MRRGGDDLRHRRHLHALRRAARRGAGGGRHGALPVAPRLLQPAHRRGAARAGAEPGRLLRGRARGGPDRRRARSSSRLPARARRCRRRDRRRSSSSAPARRATPRPRCCAARAIGGPITLIGPERRVPYDRPNLSKDYLAGNAPEEWIPLRPPEFYAEHRIELRLGAAGDGDRSRGEDGDPRRTAAPLPYGALLLATGAEPVRLPTPGRRPAARPRPAHPGRQPGDHRARRRRRSGRWSIGASFIGLEVAAALRARELEVTVVAPEDRPLEQVMGPELGDFIRALHEEHGVTFRLGRKPTAIERARGPARERRDARRRPGGARRGRAARARAGRGGRARRWTTACWSTSTWRRAPRASSRRATSRAGPIRLRGERIRVEHWVVAERQGQTAARNILGRRERFDDVPFFWSQHYDVHDLLRRPRREWDAIEVSGSLAKTTPWSPTERRGRSSPWRTIFRDQQSLEAEVAMEAGEIRGSWRRSCRG